MLHVQPDEVKPVIEGILAMPLDQTGDALADFQWRFGKGDVHHWIPLLDRIDDFFKARVNNRKDLKLEFDQGTMEEADPFPTQAILNMLNVTATILENCNNKHLYNSVDSIGLLLAASDSNIVLGGLKVLAVLSRRSYPTSLSWVIPESVASRLLEISKPWSRSGGVGGFENMLTCALAEGSAASVQSERSKLMLSSDRSIHYEYYPSIQAAAVSDAGPIGTTPAASTSKSNKNTVAPASLSGAHVVHISNMDDLPQDDLEALKQLVLKFNVPLEYRFPLLIKLRVSRHLRSSQANRLNLVRARLLAFYTVVSVHPSQSSVTSMIAMDPDFVSNLAQILRHEESIEEDIQVLALKALGIQLLERTRASIVVHSIAGSSQASLLTLLLHRGVASLTGAEPVPVVHSPHYLEALLAIPASMVATREGLHALNETCVLPAILPLVHDKNPEHATVVSLAVRVIESCLDYDANSHASFAELHGVKQVVDRLEYEVNAALAVPGIVPYNQRLLIKSLLRTANTASFAPGIPTRPDEVQSQRLYKCLVGLFQRAKDFGGGLFSLTSSIMADVMHHDPLQYRNLESAGVPEAFVKCTVEGLIPSPEAVAAMPSALIALCLNSNGQQLILKNKVLNCLIPVFTTKNYLRALQGEGASNLGSGLEELVRHAPALRGEGVSLALDILYTLCVYGGETNPPKPLPAPAAASQEPEPAPAVDGDDIVLEAHGDDNTREHAHTQDQPQDQAVNVQAMETDAPAPSLPAASRPNDTMETEQPDVPTEVLREATPSVVDVGSTRPEDISTFLVECVTYTARMLESLLRGAETAKAFVERGGPELLLTLYRLPALPPTFGSTNASHSLLATFRMLTQPNNGIESSKVFIPLKSALMQQLDTALELAQRIGMQCVPMLEIEERNTYVRAVSTAEGLTAMLATLVRISSGLLKDVSSGEQSTITKIGLLEHWVLKQAAVADVWRMKRSQQELPSSDNTSAGTANDGGKQNHTAAATTATTASAQAKDDQQSGKDKKAKKTPEELAHEILAHFLHTTRSFYQAVAKAIHVPARRRDELAKPNYAMRTAALNLAAIITRNLQSQEPLVTDDWVAPQDLGSGLDTSSALRCRYLHRVLDSMFNTLFDIRRRNAHVLIYSYFVDCGGLRAFLIQFKDVVSLVKHFSTILYSQRARYGPGTPVDTPNVLTAITIDLEPNALAVHKCNLEQAYAISCISVLNSFLMLAANIVNAPMVVPAPNAATWITTLPPGGAESLASNRPKDVAALMRKVWESVLGAVIPLWTEPGVASIHPKVAQSMFSVLRGCTEQPGQFAASGRGGVRGDHPVDPDRCQQLQDMGFSRAGAETALRRVGNHMALAMEWLITHPDEVDEQPADAAHQGGASGGARTSAATEENEDSELLASAISCISQPNSSQTLFDLGQLQDLPKATMPEPKSLVRHGLALLHLSPISTFQVVDLLKAQCGVKPTNCEEIVQEVVDELKALADNAQVNDTHIFAAGHLLLVSSAEISAFKEASAKKGAADAALRLLERWIEAHCERSTFGAGGQKSQKKKTPSKETVFTPVPKWMDALLLFLGTLAASQPKQTPQSVAEARPTAGASGSSALFNTSNRNTMDAEGGADDETQHLLDSQPPPEDTPVEKAVKAIASQYNLGGLLTVEEQLRCAHIVLKLVNHLCKWADQYKLPPVNKSYDPEDIRLAEPRGTLRAALSLLSRLCARRSVTEVALQARVHTMLLALPPLLFVSEIERDVANIFYRLMEDPTTLQGAMEAHIRNTVTENQNRRYPAALSGPPGRGVSLRSVLQQCVPLAARDPRIFIEALNNSCNIVLESNVLHPSATPKATVTLKEQPRAGQTGSQLPVSPVKAPGTNGGEEKGKDETPSAGKQTSVPQQNQATDNTEHVAAGTTPAAVKPPRKVPGSFAEVVNCLIDVLLQYNALPDDLNRPKKPSKAVAASTVDTTVQGGGSTEQPVASEDRSGGGDQANAPEDEDSLDVLTTGQRNVALQCFILKLLADFTLRYQNCVAVLLRRDAELAGLINKEASAPKSGGRPSLDKRRHSNANSPAKGRRGLLAHLMHCQLALAPVYVPAPSTMPMAAASSYLLLCVCIRSAEGRRRIAAELAKTLSSSNSEAMPVNAASLATANSAFIAQKDGAPPYKVSAFLMLVTSLLSASGSSTTRPGNPAPGLSLEIAKAMKDAGMIPALLAIIKRLDVDHPEAATTGYSIIRALEALTRPTPKRPGAFTEAAAGAGKPSTAVNAGDDGAPQPVGGSARAAGDTPMADTEAGPAAVAAANHALEALDRERSREDRRAMEEMMDDMMEAAYEEAQLDAFDSEHDGTSDRDSMDDSSHSESDVSHSDHSMDDSGGDSDDESDGAPIVVELIEGESTDDDNSEGLSDSENEDGDDDDDDDEGQRLSEMQSLEDDEIDDDDEDEDDGHHMGIHGALAAMEEAFAAGEAALEAAEHEYDDDGEVDGTDGEDIDEEDGEDVDHADEEEEDAGIEDGMQDMYIDDDGMGFSYDEEDDEDLLVDYPTGDHGLDEDEADALRQPVDFQGGQRQQRRSRGTEMFNEVFGNLFGGDEAANRAGIPLFRTTISRRDGRVVAVSGNNNGPGAQSSLGRHPLLMRPSNSGEATQAAGAAGSLSAAVAGARAAGGVAANGATTEGLPYLAAHPFAGAPGANDLINALNGFRISRGTDMAGAAGQGWWGMSAALQDFVSASGQIPSSGPSWLGEAPPTALNALTATLERAVGSALGQARQEPQEATGVRAPAAIDERQTAVEDDSPAIMVEFEDPLRSIPPSQGGLSPPHQPVSPPYEPVNIQEQELRVQPVEDAAPAAEPSAPQHEQPALSPGQGRPRQRQRTDSGVTAAMADAAAAPAPQAVDQAPGPISADAFQHAWTHAWEATNGPSAPSSGAAAHGRDHEEGHMNEPVERVTAGEDVEMEDVIEPQEEVEEEEQEDADDIDGDILAAAEIAGIDPTFLQALPPELRAEVLSAAGISVLRLPAQGPIPPPAEAPDNQPAAAEVPAAPYGDQSAPEAAAGGASQLPEMEGIDPEFMAALPPELQAEVLEQHRRERRLREAAARRERERERTGTAAPVPAELDFASLVASFPREIREEALLTADESMLNLLPANLLEEARALRERLGGAAFDQQAGGAGPSAEATFNNALLQTLGRARRETEALLGNRAASLREMLLGATARGVRRGQHPRGDGNEDVQGPRSALSNALSAKATASWRRRSDLPAIEPPLDVDDDGLVSLLRLFRLGQGSSKSSLAKLCTNLSINSQSRQSLLKLLVSSITGPLSYDELPAVVDREQLQLSPAVVLGLTKVYEGAIVPTDTTSRVLEILGHLFKHQTGVHDTMLGVSVLPMQLLADRITATKDVKGKGKAIDLGQSLLDDGGRGQPALHVLLALMLRTVSAKSHTIMAQALDVLRELFREYEYHIYTRWMKLHTAQLADAAAAEEKAKNAPQQALPEAAGAQGGDATVADEPQEPAQQQGASAAPGGEVTAVDASLDDAHNRQETVAALAGPSRQGQHVPGSSRFPGDVAGTDSDEARDAKIALCSQAIERIPTELLCQLVRLLGSPDISERSAMHLKTLFCTTVEFVPSLHTLYINEVVRTMVALSNDLEGGLKLFVTMDIHSSGLLACDVATIGKRMARYAYFCRDLVNNLEWTPSVAWKEGEKGAQYAVLRSALAALEDGLKPTWHLFSLAAGHVEEALRASQAAESSKILPPGVAQLQTLMQCYFLLADAVRAVHDPPTEDYITHTKQGDRIPWLESSQGQAHNAPRPTSSQLDIMNRVNSAGAGPSSQTQSQQVATPSSPTKRAMSDSTTAPFLVFAEKHRRLINLLIHHTPSFLKLGGSFTLLLRAPRLLDFDNKRAYFRSRTKERDHRMHYGQLRLSVRRDHVFEDSFYQLRVRTPEEMRRKLSVTFAGEEGVDAGGLSREWYQVMSREMFNPQFSLFEAIPEGGSTFQPNPNSVVQSDPARGTDHLDFFKFVGRVVGKAVHDSQHIDAHFTRSFYKHLLGAPLTYEDIEAVDPDFYKNLRWMLENDITDVLDLTFSEETDYFGKKNLVELKPGGAHIKVTNANKREYVNLIARHRMTNAILPQIEAFLKGFWDVVPRELISLFNDHELELLISGLPEIDVDDLRANTEYQGYSSSSTVITWFWEVVREMDEQDLALLVQFVTGTSKVPLEGFKALQGVSGPQKFQIHKAYGPSDRLPSAHTCFNQLDLVEYESKEQLRERLRTAIHEGAEGFGFA